MLTASVHWEVQDHPHASDARFVPNARRTTGSIRCEHVARWKLPRTSCCAHLPMCNGFTLKSARQNGCARRVQRRRRHRSTPMGATHLGA